MLKLSLSLSLCVSLARSVVVHSTAALPSAAFTYRSPTTQCPFCRMAAVEQHAVYLRGGQAMYSCLMKNHYATLNTNTTALAAKLLVRNGSASAPAAGPTTTPLCPVCGMEVTELKNYVSFKRDAQRVYACSADHARLMYNSPLSFATRTQPAAHKRPAVCAKAFARLRPPAPR